MDLTTDKKNRRRGARRRKSDPEMGGNPALEQILETTRAGIGPRTPGAPIARAPRIPEPSSPIDLSGNSRRSRAFREASERDPSPAVVEAERLGFSVVSGGSDLDVDDDAGGQSRTLSPSNASALGDFVAAMAGPAAGAAYLGNIAVFVGTALLVILIRAHAKRSALSEGEVAAISPLVSAIGVFALALADRVHTGTEPAGAAALIALGAGALAAVAVKLIADRFVHVRIAVIGDAADAHALAWQLAHAGTRRYEIVGYVTRTSERDNLRDLDHVSFKVRRLGLLNDLSHVVARNDIEMLVMASSNDRMKVFERAAVCTERYRTRLISLTAFEEAVFRRVPVAQLNVAWFQHIMHPRFRPAPRLATRAIDVTLATLIGVLTAPIWLCCAAYIKVFFGGPVLVRRRRVGERGSSFSVIRFRVAANDENGDPPSEDTPARGFGRVLRRTRIEGLPQLICVLRGDMNLVGPAPVTPMLINEVEKELPYFARRSLLRPGLTGWAQISNIKADHDEPASMLSRDLFYLKNQSLFLYLYVLIASLGRLIAGERGGNERRSDS